MVTVFVIQDLGKMNFSPAKDYGRLKICIDRHVPHVELFRALSDLRERMKGITKNDWIVPTGHPALIGVACHLMASHTGVIRLLVWDRQTKSYVRTELTSGADEAK